MYVTERDLQQQGMPLDTDENWSLKLVTPEVLRCIRDVVRDAATPSWLNSVPSNFGNTACGMLKADEWHTMWSVYLSIALVSLWGEGTSHPSAHVLQKLCTVLDHTMALVSPLTLACLHIMT